MTSLTLCCSKSTEDKPSSQGNLEKIGTLPNSAKKVEPFNNGTAKKVWGGVAVAVGILVVIGVGGFGIVGLLHSHGLISLPPSLQWLASAIGTVGNGFPHFGGLWIMGVGGVAVGGIFITIGSLAIHQVVAKQKWLDDHFKKTWNDDLEIDLRDFQFIGPRSFLGLCEKGGENAIFYINDGNGIARTEIITADNVKGMLLCLEHEYGYSKYLESDAHKNFIEEHFREDWEDGIKLNNGGSYLPARSFVIISRPNEGTFIVINDGHKIKRTKVISKDVPMITCHLELFDQYDHHLDKMGFTHPTPPPEFYDSEGGGDISGIKVSDDPDMSDFYPVYVLKDGKYIVFADGWCTDPLSLEKATQCAKQLRGLGYKTSPIDLLLEGCFIEVPREEIGLFCQISKRETLTDCTYQVQKCIYPNDKEVYVIYLRLLDALNIAYVHPNKIAKVQGILDRCEYESKGTLPELVMSKEAVLPEYLF